MEEIKVDVKVHSMIYDLLCDEDTKPDKISYTAEGRFYQNGEQLELSYNEPDDIGMDGCVTTLIFFADNPTYINMHRTGDVTSGLSFDKNNHRQTCITTVNNMPIEFAVYTRNLSNSLCEEGGMINLDYVLEFKGIKTQRNVMRIDIKPRKEENNG